MLLAVQMIWWLAAAELRASGQQELAVWAEGPVRWLLLPEERKELKAVGKDDDASAFIYRHMIRGVKPAFLEFLRR